MMRWPFTHYGRKAISYGCDGRIFHLVLSRGGLRFSYGSLKIFAV